MSYGLTSTGFVTKTLATIRAEINASVQASLGASVDVSDDSSIGMLIGIFAEREAQQWELAEAAYNAQNPDTSTGAALDGVCALTGTLRLPPAPSTVEVIATGTPATTVPLATTFATLSTSIDFKTLAAATIALSGSRVNLAAYAVGAIFSNSGNVYVCTVAGSTSGAGPSGTGTAIVDGTSTWKYVGAGTGHAKIAAASSVNGEFVALADDITVIRTPVGGMSSVRNLLDATPGLAYEPDESLRLRRQAELAASGASTVDALRSDLLRLAGVTAATVFANNTDVTDVDGVTPHAIECMVSGGTNQDIFDFLLANVDAGIGTFGSTYGTALDSLGVSYLVKFSRPTSIDIYATLNIIVDAATFPINGATLIEEAIVAFGDAQKTGKNAVAASIGAQAFKVTGVLDVTSTLIGVAPAPALSTTIAISSRQLAVYDTSRITVNVTTGTP